MLFRSEALEIPPRQLPRRVTAVVGIQQRVVIIRQAVVVVQVPLVEITLEILRGLVVLVLLGLMAPHMLAAAVVVALEALKVARVGLEVLAAVGLVLQVEMELLARQIPAVAVAVARMLVVVILRVMAAQVVQVL